MSSIWRAIAGADVRIPAKDSEVLYLPNVHIDQSTGVMPADHPGLDLQTPRLATVIDVQFHTLPPPSLDHIFARFILRPRPQGNLQQPVVGAYQWHGRQADTTVFERLIRPKDFLPSCILPRAICRALFRNPNEVIRYSDGSVLDLHYLNWSLSKGWSQFSKDKDLDVGDTLILMRGVDEGEVTIGVRRVQLHKVSGESITDALYSADMDNDYIVDYFPNAGYEPCVVLEAVL